MAISQKIVPKNACHKRQTLIYGRSRRSICPLSRLLHFYVEATHGLRLATSEFLGERPARVPFIVGVAGSVAVGKSTTARILKELMSRWPHTPRVELVTTDGFPAAQCRTGAARADAPQGFPGSTTAAPFCVLWPRSNRGWPASTRPNTTI